MGNGVTISCDAGSFLERPEYSYLLPYPPSCSATWSLAVVALVSNLLVLCLQSLEVSSLE